MGSDAKPAPAPNPNFAPNPDLNPDLNPGPNPEIVTLSHTLSVTLILACKVTDRVIVKEKNVIVRAVVLPARVWTLSRVRARLGIEVRSG